METTLNTIRAAGTRKADGWYPTLEYAHGGRVIGDIQCVTLAEAVHESENMIQCMADYPVAFLSNHPAPNQLIDLSHKRGNKPLVRHLAAQYLKYLRKEVRETDGRKFPCSWLWLGLLAKEACDKLKPIATDNGIPWSEVELLANADRLAGVK